MVKHFSFLFLLMIASYCDAYEIIYSAREEYYLSQIYVRDEEGNVEHLLEIIDKNIGYDYPQGSKNGDFILTRRSDLDGNYDIVMLKKNGEINKSLSLGGYMDFPQFSADERGVYFVQTYSNTNSDSIIYYWDLLSDKVSAISPKRGAYSEIFVSRESSNIGYITNNKELGLYDLGSGNFYKIYKSHGRISDPVFYEENLILFIEKVDESYNIISINRITGVISTEFTLNKEIFFIEKLPSQSSLLVGLAASEYSYDTVFYEAKFDNEGVKLLNDPIHLVEAPVYLPDVIDRH